MDKYLISGSLALLIIQSVLLLSDLGVLPSPFFSTLSSTSGKPIGHIKQVHQKVKRRTFGTLIWEKSHEQQKLYLQDSVLTLSESSTDIVIQNDIELHLSENTLVVIEPIKDLNKGVQLKFAKGDLSANTERSPISLQTKAWTITALPKSQFSVRQGTNQELELEVHKGELKLKDPNRNPSQAEQSLRSGQRAHVTASKSVTIKNISHQMDWDKALPRRVYSHNFPIIYELQWLGAAQKLSHLLPDGNRKIHRLAANQNSLALQLAPGHHHFYLEDDHSSSTTFSIEVWKAPVVQYFSPLPRNRATTKLPLDFHWSTHPYAKAYRLEFLNPYSPLTAPRSFEVIKPHHTLTLKDEGALLWNVWIVDKEGFLIPPAYNYPVFYLDNPLAAPKLRSPAHQMRKGEKESSSTYRFSPKSPKLSWWITILETLLPRAHAEEVPLNSPTTTQTKTTKTLEVPAPIEELIFEWLPVPGAEFYVIEISSSRTFRQPEVIQKVKSTEFHWRNFSQSVFYWRVAAGQGNGVLGLFSEPETFDLKSLKAGNITSGIRYRIFEQKSKVSQKNLTRTPLSEQALEPNPPLPAVPKKKAASIEPERLTYFRTFHGGLSLSAIHHFRTESSGDSVQNQLSGFSSPGGHLWLSVPSNEGLARFLFQGTYSQMKWEPESQSNLPFQSELRTSYYRYSLYYQYIESRWSWGVTVSNQYQSIRESTESISLNEATFYGLTALYEWHPHIESRGRHSLFLSANGDLQQYAFENDLQWIVIKGVTLSAFVGARLNFQFFNGKNDYKGFHSLTGFEIGFEY